MRVKMEVSDGKMCRQDHGVGAEHPQARGLHYKLFESRPHRNGATNPDLLSRK
jgi:hypothetical protein